MAIPLSYNLRNLWVRRTTTMMTVLGIALTVAVLLGILAMVAGLREALTTTGNPLNLLVLRKNSASELVSQITREAISTITFKNGIQKFPGGQPMVLFVDQQTTGGYPIAASVITADISSLAQLRPRDAIRFEMVTMERARELLLELEASIEAEAFEL